MKPSTFLPLYEKLEALVNRLPQGLQTPILREITPIKTLFLMQRPPRIVLVGPNGAGKAELLAALFGAEVFRPGEENLSDGHWQTIGRAGRGSLRLLDARRPISLPLLRDTLTQEAPDLFVFARPVGPIDDTLAADLDHTTQLLPVVTPREGATPKLLGLLLPGTSSDTEAARQELHAVLHTRPELSARMVGTLALSADAAGQRLAELIAIELPGEAQLEMARLSGNRVLQKQIAQVIIKSITAICTAIGTQPIPLADFPVLTSLQATMVAGIMHISGREMSAKLAAEFMTAVGANVGLGLALREGTRAAMKFLPGWGNAISGAVAGAGTYSVGHAAVAYFIEGVSLQDARGIFRKRKKDPKLLKE
ncbi:MAG: DUF697 domain-containing protein [Chthoniobacter sp.]|uniref:DUF697 domain-containing protein n=1 Tax=Chthoniobacter sp. TaxID=2510640 RepID=UPI0032A448EF